MAELGFHKDKARKLWGHEGTKVVAAQQDRAQVEPRVLLSGLRGATYCILRVEDV